MHTYTFTIADGDAYEVDIAISGNINLYGLAEHIIDAIGFDFDHAFGFYDNLRDIYRSREKYTLFSDMGESEDDEPGVQRTLIQDVFEPGKKMIFMFDYGDDWQFLVTCKKIDPARNKRKVRRVLAERGAPPVQYPPWDEEPDEEQ